MTGVRRFLISGPDEKLTRFHLTVASRLNAIERRGQTVFYTCLAEDAAFALRVADAADVTVQEIDVRGDDETYPVLHRGADGLQWEPRLTRH